MKKQLIFMIALSLISIMLGCHSCSSFRNLINLAQTQETTYFIDHPQKFELIDNHIVVPVIINRDTQKWIFDTHGSSVLFTRKGTWTDTLTKLPDVTIAIRKDAAGGSFNPEFTMLPSADCNLFSINNWFVASLESPFPCKEGGLFGGEDLSKEDKMTGVEAQLLKIDFDDSTLCCIDTVPTQNWQTVKSSFPYLSYFKIYFKIGDKEYKFDFDTGYSGSINMDVAQNDENIHSLPTQKITYGHLFTTVGGEVKGTMETKITDKINLNDMNICSEITLVPKEMNNLVGIEFIKHFNWIIDYKNQKVYAQKRKTPYHKTASFYSDPQKIGASFNFTEMPVTVSNLVKEGKAEKSGFQLNDIILKINNIDISTIEPCEREEYFKGIIQSSEETVFEMERNGKQVVIAL